MTTFGEALRAERIKADLTQSEFASLVGVWQANVSHWERSTSTPVRENLDKLYEYFPALRDLPEPDCREAAKPCGNPNGNPGKRSEKTRLNMSLARTGLPNPRRNAVDAEPDNTNDADDEAERLVSLSLTEPVSRLIANLCAERDAALMRAERAEALLNQIAALSQKRVAA